MTTIESLSPTLTFTPPALPDVIAKVREIAAENPDFVYRVGLFESGCLYVGGHSGGCIVGRALVALGVPPGFFTAERPVVGVLNRTAISIEFPRIFGWPTDRELTWLRRVQFHQDEMAPWGAAVTLADEAFPLTSAME